jgi:ABC-type Zn uptake system ZnuABC Zn-binding protein ZnuA
MKVPMGERRPFQGAVNPPSGERRRVVTALALLALAILLAGCGRTAPSLETEIETSIADLVAVPLAAGEKLQVVATTTNVADMARRVAGESAEVTPLIPPGADPHSFEPTPGDLQAVAEADVVFVNGFGLEQFLAELLNNAGGDAPVVSLSQGIQPRSMVSAESADGSEGEHGLDPHVWLDPNNMIVWVDNLSAALSALDPAHRADYAANAERARTDLEGLDAAIQQAVAPIPVGERLLVTDHDEFGYFAEEYGFTVVGTVIPGFSSAAEPSAGELAALEDAIRELGARAVFVSAVVSPGLAQRVADDTGIRLVTLYAHSLTGPDGPAPDYLSLMRYNVGAIVSALLP